MERIQSRLDGPILVKPVIHRDQRGFFHESYRRSRYAELGIPDEFELNEETLHQLSCPIGFAHGFCVTSETADVLYKCDAYYDESIERGIRYDDPEIGIEWPAIELIPSERDANAPRLSEVADELPFEYSVDD